VTTANVKYFEYKRTLLEDGTYDDYVGKSELLNVQLQEKLEKQIASYFVGNGWKLLYSSHTDGRSYRT
jgi:hypothetical protein